MSRFDHIELPPALRGCAEEFVFDRASVRALDAAAMEEFGLPGAVLMENAATALAHVADAMLRVTGGGALILCGPGNNGGDGFALARKLNTIGHAVRVVTLADPSRYRDEAAMNRRVLEKMALPLAQCNAGSVADLLDAEWSALNKRGVIIDAMFGTGLTAPPRAPFDDAIAWINERREIESSAVLAVDLPSGLDCDSGAELGRAVRADLTVTLAGMKKGLLNSAAQPYVGRVLAAEIGAPRVLVARLGSARDKC